MHSSLNKSQPCAVGGSLSGRETHQKHPKRVRVIVLLYGDLRPLNLGKFFGDAHRDSMQILDLIHQALTQSSYLVLKIFSVDCSSCSTSPIMIFGYNTLFQCPITLERSKVHGLQHATSVGAQERRCTTHVRQYFTLTLDSADKMHRYDIPNRLSSVQVYPVPAPNGSSIIICGHDAGLRILWRGGRPFKPPGEPKGGKPSINGENRTEVMVIDSDEEDAPYSASKQEGQSPEFESRYEEVDPDTPFENILRVLDIPMAAIRQISIPNVPRNIQQVAPGAYPPILYEHIVVAAACTDFSIALVSLPLTPPAPTVNDLAQARVQIVKLLGPQSHQDFPTSVSVTYTYEERDTASGSRSRNRQNDDEDTEGRDWSFLIASTSPTAGGLLLVHEVSLAGEQLQAEGSIPIQRQYLRSGIGCKVVFNPSAAPTSRHSNLLIVFPSGTVKVYQCLQDRDVRRPRNRRDSSGTMDSMTSKSGVSQSEGKMLLTLHAAFAPSNTGTPHRTRILDAAWVLGGTAILAILEDASWGVWDIEGTVQSSSGAKPQNLLQGSNSTPTTINGRQLTQLSLKGRISVLDESPHQDTEITDKPTKLAPMTPHTRKARSEGLFKRKTRPSSSSFSAESVCLKGGISVTSQISRNLSPEESVLIFYGKQNIFIPNLPLLIRAQSQDKDNVEVSPLARPTIIPSLSLPTGTPQTSITQLPPSALSPANTKPTLAFTSNSSTPDILVTTAHHLVFLCKPIEESEFDNEDTMEEDEEEADSRITDLPQEDDQLLLTQGDLDIDGMSRILDGMKNGSGTPTRSKMHGRSIGPGRKGKGVAR